MSDAPFVERIFELDSGELVVRFFTPFRRPDGEFRCDYDIGWPDGEVRRFACGLDGIQALMLAMRSVHTDLANSASYKVGRLTYCHQADLDLPPTWGVGPLYDVPPP